MLIHVPPDQVDVNVHPAKVEVKFQDRAAELYTLILAAVKKALLLASWDAYKPILPMEMT